MSDTQPATLFVTIGAGNPKYLEATLYTPISKSLATGTWARIVLVPSPATLSHAEEIRSRHSELDVLIDPLPGGSAENDADRCYEHIQAGIARHLVGSPDVAAVDVTRGTKVMSAALMLAAFRHRIPNIRYVEGDRDPENPQTIIPGTERVRDVPAAAAVLHRTLDDARLLFEQGSFAAAGQLLATLPPSEEVAGARGCADFHSAWDRLDHRAAATLAAAWALPPTWASFASPPERFEWVAMLAEQPDRGDASAMAAHVRRLAVDLLANGERRIVQRQFEDAVLRAYRVAELVGQARLFDHELDSARLPPDHPAVSKLQRDLVKKGSAGFGTNRDGTLTAPRELTARLLKRLGDTLHADLLGLVDDETYNLALRNHSILVHGFSAVGPSAADPLARLYAELESILLRDRPEAEADLLVARFHLR